MAKRNQDPWIREIGFPVLTVAEEPGQIAVRQSRFLSTGDVKAEEDKTLWWIPLGLKTDAQAKEEVVGALTTKEEILRNIDETFYKLNTDQIGFYRTNYPPGRLAKLGASKDRLSIEDRIGLVGDAAALAIAGHATTASLLTFLENFKDEIHHAYVKSQSLYRPSLTSSSVWVQIIGTLTNIRSVFAENESVANGLKTFTSRLVEAANEKIGWEFGPNDDYLTGQVRALLIRTAGGAGHKG